jgi:uncharacterized protein (TIGR02145 family)
MIIVLVLQFNSFPQKVDISGRVLSKDNVPQSGVIAFLRSQNLSDTTGPDGTYRLYREANPAFVQKENTKFLPVTFVGTTLSFTVKQPQQTVTIDIYNLIGKKIGTVLNEKVSAGIYSINTLGYCKVDFSSQLYIIRLQIDNEIYFHKTVYFANSLNRRMLGKSIVRSMDALLKRTQENDTITFSKDSQVIITVGISNLIEVLPDLFIVQRDVYGNLKPCQDSIGKIQTVISGSGIPDSTPKIVNLWYNYLTNGYSGFVYFVYSAAVQNYSLFVRVYNTDSIYIARSAILSFPSTAGNINLPDFSTCNAKPVVYAGNDTVVSVKDSIKLHAAAVDSFGGSIAKWEWSINGYNFVKTSKGDTVIIAPSNATTGYKCIVKATDNDGNITIDSMNVTVVQDIPIINFLSADTVVDHGGVVRCSVYVQQQFGTMTVEIDTANSGNYKGLGSLGLASGKAYSFLTGNACSWDSVKVQITDDDGNVVVKGFRVRIRPQPLTITSIDSTVNTVTVHYGQSQETDFAQYRIYRNTISAVDTNSELWATITAIGTVSNTTPTPSYAWNPRYYRVFQKDTEGMWSAGSNVVYGNVVNNPPPTPKITSPTNEGDSVWTDSVMLGWNRCIDPNGNGVRYRVFVNYNNTGYAQYATALVDTFVQMTYDSLSFKFKVIAYDTLGDSSAWSAERTAFIRPVISDIDGNPYRMVTIGTQVWMAENLKTTRYNDGTPIPLALASVVGSDSTPAGYCWYNNDSANKDPYGALYNWYAVETGKLAPAGWHIPTDAEWTTLTIQLGGDSVAGGKLKEAGLAHWQPPNTSATNETGFSALPYGGSSADIGYFGRWWTSTDSNADRTYYAWYCSMGFSSASVGHSNFNKNFFHSVRCVRN